MTGSHYRTADTTALLVALAEEVVGVVRAAVVSEADLCSWGSLCRGGKTSCRAPDTGGRPRSTQLRSHCTWLLSGCLRHTACS